MSSYKDRKAYNNYMNDYLKRRWQRRRVQAVEQLGSECIICGSDQDLEFDHIDPETRTMTIARASTRSEEFFQSELSKCQLLCVPCHSEKTEREFEPYYEEVRVCACGRQFDRKRQYAGHKRWCNV